MMIVYRKQEQRVASATCLSRIRTLAEQFGEGGTFTHEAAVELLIEWGVFESAVTDALCPERDGSRDILHELRKTGLIVGHIFSASWEGKREQEEYWGTQLRSALRKLYFLSIPEMICIREHEGYAHYGLYPETYLEAAKAFAKEHTRESVLCIGLRSIGTSLSLAVAAVLEEEGYRVESCTLRPRGDPFDRRILLEHTLEEVLRSLPYAYVLIIDEGPGMSGSSICCAAQKLSETGIADTRIVLFPSWEPDGRNFISERARERWLRHKKYTAGFEEVLYQSGKIMGPFSDGTCCNISAGMWRSLFYEGERDFPAVHPHHEKRKFLCRNHRDLLVKFAGLGRYGRVKFERASILADAGFSPPAIGFANGFIASPFVQGRPLTRDDVSESLLSAVARYLSYLKKNFTVDRDMQFSEMARMIRRNTYLGLGKEWVHRLRKLGMFRSLFEESPPVALDGRMLPNEWLLTERGYIKTDTVDHHADQFFPCCQDIAWDIAGTIIEFGLDQKGSAYLVERYERMSHDRDIAARLSFYRIAYLAYRLGYATFAARDLGMQPDGAKFRGLVQQYADLLKKEITILNG
ncbi:MAG: hypothetical protein AB1553_00185 [Nitrospirota bacterium]